MTISSETRKAGPFNGNDVTTSFPFTFKAFEKANVRVIYTDALLVETTLVLDSDYTIALNGDQNANPGGTVTYSLLATGEKLTIIGAVEYTQETDIQNQGGFYPEVIENALDKVTMQIQQIKEIADRSVQVPVSSDTLPEDYLTTVEAYKVEAAASASAASTSETNALASKNAAAASEAAAAASYDSFDDRYLGVKTSDPALDNDGNALLVGALYFNSASNVMRVYNGTVWQSTNLTAIADALYFRKPASQAHCFTKTGAGTISILAGTDVTVAGTLVSFAAQTAVVMPTLNAGTDYAIYACTDGTIRADASFTAPSGYTVNNSRQIGGFHYAPGGNAAAQAGGNTTPAINEYSIWDLKFRPACSDPRGMALIAGSFWADIYLLCVDYLTNGSSKYNVSIADGFAPPKRSTLYGGNGTTTYADGNWWNMNEALKHCGKRSPTYSEFAAFAYGTTEATSSGGTDVPTTGATGTGATSAWNLFTSKFGIIQASGCLWIWGDEFGGGAAAAGYVANTQGRGGTYQMENAVLLGGAWNEAANSGSRCSNWSASAPASNALFGARGVCDHLILI